MKNQNAARQHPRSPRFIKVSAPNGYAGVGSALRQAFRLDGESRSLTGFDDLLARLD